MYGEFSSQTKRGLFWLSGECCGTSQACYHGWLEYEARHEQRQMDGRPRGRPTEESIFEALPGFFDGSMIAKWWCRDFEHFLEDLENGAISEQTEPSIASG